MRQYNQIKQKYPESLLLFRMGDFFETFDDDAVITAKVCGIILTKRNNGAGSETPLAGFPHHQLDSYLPKLVKAGYRVAVCEQLEDPKLARGIVKRGVVEVVTPGVAFYDKLLETKNNNYVAGIYLKNDKAVRKLAGVSVADISTGEFQACELPLPELKDLLTTLAPAEIIISKSQKDELAAELDKIQNKPLITKREDWIFEYDFGRDLLLKQFKTQSLKGFGIEDMTVGISAAGCILNYIAETQQSNINHLSRISRLETSDFMSLDPSTRRNLEITFSSNSEGSLISVIDRTITPMGGRLLKKWISMPLTKLEPIIDRQQCVSAFFENPAERNELRKILSAIGDTDRLIAKISSGRANPRDCVALKTSLELVPKIHKLISGLPNDTINNISKKFSDTSNVVEFIKNALIDEPTVQLGTGQVFRNGYDEKLDTYITAKTSGTDWIKNFQESERLKSGVHSLKVGFNNVFGYYIEVTKIHAHKVPDYFVRKQTLTNAERYTTPELKEIEDKILGAEEKISEVEQVLFAELKSKIAEFTSDIQNNSYLVAVIDCLQGMAQIASDNNYVKPEIDNSEIIEIEDGRHPVVEKMLPVGENFTPNNTYLDSASEQIHIITGPNMSGKSCYLRQVAVITLLTQIGSYVPAKRARIGLVDKIFTRVGAQDNITAGESTFLVEMQEAANILNNATDKSLILLDEVGRGTATFDGISIAWSIAEYLHNQIGARTLFATHYHELNELTERYERIVNYRVEVIETGSSIIFSHKVSKGGSDYSFGIHVAKMAGLPYDVIYRANEIMATLESDTSEESVQKNKKADIKSIKTKKAPNETDQLAIFEFRDDAVRAKLQAINIDSITPLQAFNLLAELKKEAEKS
ncbi:MAG: DNA mismatch repair protein MutS [Candidatus Kapabacteria bacterium]|nr:DNA mismatch repair protein MutS [Ignavibacteriota bacterium]MCW5884100.1 DNA mismatch repair protein MutS [Candidatus Kapabacteria bacterium]